MTDDVLLPAGKEWPSRGEGAFSRMHVDGRPTVSCSTWGPCTECMHLSHASHHAHDDAFTHAQIRCPRMLIITHDASPLQVCE